ncbi:hypothetical protein L1887_11064 [Cichorium endivia]|nr:hypothetical protein L1887_11064 [Cichorium endivia]
MSPVRENNINSPIQEKGRTHTIGSSIKRRRIDSSIHSSLPCRSLFVREDPTNGDDRSKIVGSAPMDLNRAPSTSSEAGGSIPDEVRATVMVGKEVGFQIDLGNDILKKSWVCKVFQSFPNKLLVFKYQGISNEAKVSWLCRLKSTHKVNFIVIQGT